MNRFCVFDDRPVKLMTEEKKSWGKGESEGEYLHVTPEGSCGRRVLNESQTYTEGESDLNPPSEAQL